MSDKKQLLINKFFEVLIFFCLFLLALWFAFGYGWLAIQMIGDGEEFLFWSGVMMLLIEIAALAGIGYISTDYHND